MIALWGRRRRINEKAMHDTAKSWEILLQPSPPPCSTRYRTPYNPYTLPYKL
jgi:hypothetical protein